MSVTSLGFLLSDSSGLGQLDFDLGLVIIGRIETPVRFATFGPIKIPARYYCAGLLKYFCRRAGFKGRNRTSRAIQKPWLAAGDDEGYGRRQRFRRAGRTHCRAGSDFLLRAFLALFPLLVQLGFRW